MLQVPFGLWEEEEEEKNLMMHHPRDYDFGLTLADISIACVVFMGVTALQSDREIPLFLRLIKSEVTQTVCSLLLNVSAKPLYMKKPMW